MFMVLSSWQSHCESSPGSFDKCHCSIFIRKQQTAAPAIAKLFVAKLVQIQSMVDYVG